MLCDDEAPPEQSVCRCRTCVLRKPEDVPWPEALELEAEQKAKEEQAEEQRLQEERQRMQKRKSNTSKAQQNQPLGQKALSLSQKALSHKALAQRAIPQESQEKRIKMDKREVGTRRTSIRTIESLHSNATMLEADRQSDFRPNSEGISAASSIMDPTGASQTQQQPQQPTILLIVVNKPPENQFYPPPGAGYGPGPARGAPKYETMDTINNHELIFYSPGAATIIRRLDLDLDLDEDHLAMDLDQDHLDMDDHQDHQGMGLVQTMVSILDMDLAQTMAWNVVATTATGRIVRFSNAEETPGIGETHSKAMTVIVNLHLHLRKAGGEIVKVLDEQMKSVKETVDKYPDVDVDRTVEEMMESQKIAETRVNDVCANCHCEDGDREVSRKTFENSNENSNKNSNENTNKNSNENTNKIRDVEKSRGKNTESAWVSSKVTSTPPDNPLPFSKETTCSHQKEEVIVPGKKTYRYVTVPVCITHGNAKSCVCCDCHEENDEDDEDNVNRTCDCDPQGHCSCLAGHSETHLHDEVLCECDMTNLERTLEHLIPNTDCTCFFNAPKKRRKRKRLGPTVRYDRFANPPFVLNPRPRCLAYSCNTCCCPVGRSCYNCDYSHACCCPCCW
ncbi:GL18486 [Drosophila persimilis]|uniref:GL18486 n=1 Tax=Drosophila persimilis TaxID=7234 RepID=B4G7N5_DROPE|nr:GL18486 [Drosophila persimilis]